MTLSVLMDPARWSRVEELFAVAATMAPAARAAYLEEACGGDAGLRDDVTALLGADDGAHRALSDAIGRAAAELAVGESTLAPGTRLGAWSIVRELGRGGMGAVYLAERADGEYTAQAAIKLVHTGPAQPSLMRRFRLERQILASLHHPNIAQLFDGGVTEDGTPYVVMEYVAGEPITSWCDRKQLSIPARLRLFLTVCSAVAHAHRNLVVHRDLKPGNIFVAEDGSPKLLDFGIAKLLAEVPDENGGTDTTAAIRLMTPAYASPEQARGARVTTATDVYSLGVVLFELLAGHRPYRIDGLTSAEAERVIATTVPPRPSSVVTTGGDEASVVRATSPDRLHRQLRGDLDTIILMALRKEPERRYASVERLAEDLERHLRGLPVLARADALGYRSRKFVLRHQAGVAATLGVLALTAVYTARLGRERDRARAEARNAERVATFLSEIFSVADPAESFGADLTARELLERSVRRADRELAEQPRAQATLLGAIGGVYRGLGRYAEATSYLERALALRRGRNGGTALDLADAEYALGGLLAKTGAVQRAESLYRASLERRERELAPDHPDRIRSLVGLGSLRASIGDEAGASEILGRAVSEARRGGDDDWEVLAEALAASGDVAFSGGEFAESEQLYREVLQLRASRAGSDHPRTLRATTNLARVLAAGGDIRGADSILRGTISLGKRVLGPEHPDIATWIGERATMLAEQGEYRSADSLMQEMVVLLRARLGPKHPQVGNAVRQLATTRYEEAMYPEAERGIVEALSIHRNQFPDDHPDVRMDLNGLALINIDAGQADSGLRIVRRLQALVRRQLGNEHPEVLVYLNNEGTALRNLGRLAESDSVLRAGVALAEKLFADEAALGRVLLSLNVAVNSVLGDRYEEAERLARPVLSVVKRELGERNRYMAYTLFVAGRADLELGRPAEGERELRQAVAILESFAPTFWGLGLARAGIAASLAAQARWDDAAGELQRARQLMAAYPPPGATYVDNANRSLRRIYERAGRRVPFELRGR